MNNTPVTGREHQNVEGAENLLAIRNVSFSYACRASGTGKVLDCANFELGRGELVSLTGSNGSGKTTFLLICAGLLKPDEGEVVTRSGTRVSLSLQLPEKSFFNETVFDEIAYGPRRLGRRKDGIPETVEAAMASAGLPRGKSGLSPFVLSGGEKRKTALASCLSVEPEILLLDEPGAGLDWVARKELAASLAGLSSRGTAVIMATHDPGLVSICRRVLAIAGGKVV